MIAPTIDSAALGFATSALDWAETTEHGEGGLSAITRLFRRFLADVRMPQ
ncbi:hypothetical protein [Saccharopolyspora spinosa]|nr:hypothetical protein [Saccharopolyspora spinosa]